MKNKKTDPALLKHINTQLKARDIREERESVEAANEVGENVAGLIRRKFTSKTAGSYAAHAISRARSSSGGRR